MPPLPRNVAIPRQIAPPIAPKLLLRIIAYCSEGGKMCIRDSIIVVHHIYTRINQIKRALITTVRQAGVVKKSGDKYTFTTLLSLLSVFVPD